MGYLFAPCRLPVLTLLWLAMCLLLLYEYLASPSRPVLAVLAIFVAGVLVKLVFFDLPFWELGDAFVYGGNYSFLDALMRLRRLRGDGGFLRPGFLLAPRPADNCPMRTSWPAGWRSAWRLCS